MDLQPHPIWEEVIERNLDLAAELGIVICPEIHAPTPIKHPVVDEYINVHRADRNRQLPAADRHRHLPAGDHDGQARRPERRSPGGGLAQTTCRADVDLADVLPYTAFIQAKFFDIDDELVDRQIPWREILQTLIDERLVRLPVQRVRRRPHPVPVDRAGPPPARAAAPLETEIRGQ